MPISKVILNGVTQMDVTDTTAEAEDVTAPEVFYSSNGTRTVGTGTGGAVSSVNGQTGDVVLDAEDVGALPSNTTIPTNTSDLTNDSGYITNSTIASDNSLGLVKTNSAQSITLNANNQLEVGGRLGQFPTTTGLFASNDRSPRDVQDFSLLITDALGIEMAANRALAIVSGMAITVQSAAPGTTVYYASNTYINRILAKVCENGYVSKDEATSKVEQIIPVVSVRINGSTFHPGSTADDPSHPIVITLAETANPDSTITALRMFGVMKSYASAHIGNGIHTDGSGGRQLIVGGGITKTGGNDACMVGQQMYNTGNGNAMFGRNHIARKNRGFFAGTGHDSSNARTEAASAVGEYSYIDSNTMFAVGNGTSATNRSNAFEVTADGGCILRDSSGGRWKITVNTSGTLTTTKVT